MICLSFRSALLENVLGLLRRNKRHGENDLYLEPNISHKFFIRYACLLFLNSSCSRMFARSCSLQGNAMFVNNAKYKLPQLSEFTAGFAKFAKLIMILSLQVIFAQSQTA